MARFAWVVVQCECQGLSMSSVAEPGKNSRFSEALFDLLDRVRYRRADLTDLSEPLHRLRYEAYRREEFVPINSQRITSDQFDRSPNAFGFGVYIDETLVSSIRLHHVTPAERTSPSRLIYGDILDPILDEGLSYVDPSRFTADHEATLMFPALPFLTLRIAAMASEYFAADFCLSSVRPEHAPFYRRVFGSEQLAGERYYPGLMFPVCLYAAKVQTIRDRVADRFPFFTSSARERELLFGPNGEVGAIAPTARMARHLEARMAAREE